MRVINARQPGQSPLEVLAASCVIVAFSPSAEAAFATDVVAADSGAELGRIVFPAASGSSAEGVEFDLEGFSEADITLIAWQLDPATRDVLSLDLRAFSGDDPCNSPADGPCANDTLTLGPQELQIGTRSCPAPPPPGEATVCVASAFFQMIELIDAAPAFACVGFEPPLAHGQVTVSGNRALPLSAELLDSDGIPVTGADVEADPVVQVAFDSSIAAASEDVSAEALWGAQGDDGNMFLFRGDKWRFRLKVRRFTAPGTYTITMASGNEAEYLVDPTCNGQFVIRDKQR